MAGGADEAEALCATLAKGGVEAWVDAGPAKRLQRAGYTVVILRAATRKDTAEVRAVLKLAGYAVQREKGGLKAVGCPYGERLKLLLQWGVYSMFEALPTVADLGLSEQDAPELMRMAVDPEFCDTQLDEAAGAPVWAWHLLAELNPPGTIPLLVGLLGSYGVDEGWSSAVLPEILSRMGQAAVPELSAVLRDETKKPLSRWLASECLRRIGEDHPECRTEVVAIITGQLERHADQEEMLNGMLVADLLDLQAVESTAVIEQVFATGRVEEDIAGDWETVQVRLGLKEGPEWTEGAVDSDEMPDWLPILGEGAAVSDDQALAEAMDEEDGVMEAGVVPTLSTMRREGLKVGRNDPCPCGSGKKFKKCCGG